MARFERHMKPIRALNENRRLKLIRDELKKDLQLQRKMLRAKKSEQAILGARIEKLCPSTIRATSETPCYKRVSAPLRGSGRFREVPGRFLATFMPIGSARAAPKCECEV